MSIYYIRVKLAYQGSGYNPRSIRGIRFEKRLEIEDLVRSAIFKKLKIKKRL